MSGKLDQSLDEIATTQRRAAGRRRNPRRSAARAAPTPAAPVGGVKKTTKPARNAGSKAAPAKATAARGDSKVIVSNLPKDVSELQIKEYFNSTVGGVKRVEISYGPNSQSRGIANVSFRDATGASKALEKCNGLLVDGRPIKVEIVVGASQVDKVMVPIKTLAERTSQPKSQPKSAAADKKKTTITKAGNAKTTGKKPRARNARPAKKTAAELDSEMADYFDAATNENANAPANAPATNGEAMDDIM